MCTQASLFLSHGIRRDVLVVAYEYSKDFVIEVSGEKVRYMGTDLRSISLLLLKALNRLSELSSGGEVVSTPGISVHKVNLKDYLEKRFKLDKLKLFYQSNDKSLNGCKFSLREDVAVLIRTCDKGFEALIKYVGLSFAPLNLSIYALKPEEFIILFNNHMDRIENEQ